MNKERFLISALADITCHKDLQQLERSLIQTLSNIHQSREYWFYKVLSQKLDPKVGLLVHAKGDQVTTSPYPIEDQVSDDLLFGIFAAIKTISIQTIQSAEDGFYYVIYPAEDKNNVISVLVEKTEILDEENNELIHSFLRIYTNHLNIIDLAHRDKLTGVFNRETLNEEISNTIILNKGKQQVGAQFDQNFKGDLRKKHTDVTYWLGVLDIDFFKSINDTFGHLYGDEVLILVARLIEKNVREYDLIFRYGGEEFVILLKASDINDAKQAFERIRLAVGHHDYAKAKQVTVSIGVSQIESQGGPLMVISEADAALYFAKENGRDQVRFYIDLLEDNLITETTESYEAGSIEFF